VVTASFDRTTVLLALTAVAAALLLGLVAAVSPPLALAGGIGIAFALVVIADASIGLCLFAVVSFLEALPGVGEVSLAKLAGGLLLVSWLAVTAARREHDRQLLEDHPVIAACALLFVCWAAASALWAEDSGKALGSAGRFALNLCLLPIVYTVVRERKHMLWFAWVFVIGAILSASYGLVVAPGDADAAAEGRLTGSGVDPNYLATSLVAAFALAVALASSRRNSGGARMVAIGSGIVLLIAVMLTVSRTGLAALAMALIAGVALAGPRRRLPLAAIGVVVFAFVPLYFAALAPTGAVERITEVSGGTGRTDIWTIGTRMVEANPVLGVGSGNFPIASIHYLIAPGVLERDDFIVDTPKVAHNIYLETLAELGPPGLLLLLAIVGSCIGCAIVAARRFADVGDSQLEMLARAVAVASLAMLTAAFLNSLQYQKPIWLILSLGPALLAMATHEDRMHISRMSRA